MGTPASNKVPLRTHEVVETLERLDLLELVGVSPWPDISDEGGDLFPIDWTEVERDVIAPETLSPADEWANQWSQVEEAMRSRVRSGGGTPPPVIVDALAWYQPIHYFGMAWGIYIKEEAVLDLAAYLLEAVPFKRRFDRDMVAGAVRLSLAVIYLHEAFHHRVESFAIGLEIVDHAKRYCPYHDKVFRPMRDQGSPDLIEEALATAESFRRRTEETYAHSVPRDLKNVAVPKLREWIRSLPPGYNRAEQFFSGGPFDDALHELCSQIDEAAKHPKRPNTEWRLAANLHRVLFTCKTVTWVLVPAGTHPIVPWFDRDVIPELSVSSRAFVKALRRRYGYKEVHGAKHLKLLREGGPTLILPTNREALSPVVLTNTAHALGFGSARAMWTELQSSS